MLVALVNHSNFSLLTRYTWSKTASMITYKTNSNKISPCYYISLPTTSINYIVISY